MGEDSGKELAPASHNATVPVDQLLLAADVFDALAAHVIYVARQRGWPALSADPDRLLRINGAIEINLL